MYSHFSTQQLPNGNAQRFTLDIPKGDVQPGEGAHKDLTTTVEPMSIGRLVDIFNVGGIPTDESFSEIDKRAFDGFRMPLERSFSPSDNALEDRSQSSYSPSLSAGLPWRFRHGRIATAVELGRSRSW